MTDISDDYIKSLVDDGFTQFQAIKMVNLIINRHPDNWEHVVETFLLAIDRDYIVAKGEEK